MEGLTPIEISLSEFLLVLSRCDNSEAAWYLSLSIFNDMLKLVANVFRILLSYNIGKMVLALEEGLLLTLIFFFFRAVVGDGPPEVYDILLMLVLCFRFNFLLIFLSIYSFNIFFSNSYSSGTWTLG